MPAVAAPTPFVADPDFTLYVGDVREVLPQLEPESVDCALTSPPFYALRNYGVDGQIGLEATPDEWVAELVAVFREVRRVLRPQGTLFIECGDSYASNPKGPGGGDKSRLSCGDRWQREASATGSGRTPAGYKTKDLIGAPWLLAFALRQDGWYLRQCIIWQKPNAMPESVRDRCTTAHSYLFLLSKSPRYWFDAEAIAEPAVEGTDLGLLRGKIGPGADGDHVAWHAPSIVKRQEAGVDSRNGNPSAMKNARSVWQIPTEGYSEAHFATWPQALVERVLKAGCPEWVCGTCGKARERLTAASFDAQGRTTNGQKERTFERRGFDVRQVKATETVGWSDCGHNNYQPGVCLDPFMGSGTTALVARRLGRRAVGVELNVDYCRMAAKRLQQLSLLA